jgi:replicative DNA helicase
MLKRKPLDVTKLTNEVESEDEYETDFENEENPEVINSTKPIQEINTQSASQIKLTDLELEKLIVQIPFVNSLSDNALKESDLKGIDLKGTEGEYSKKYNKYGLHYHSKKAKQRTIDGILGKNKGLATFPKLDRLIYGLNKEHQYVIVGESKSGKTALLMNIIFNALFDNYSLKENKYNIVINWFSLEITGPSLFQRFVSMYLYRKYKLDYSKSDLEGRTNNKLGDKIQLEGASKEDLLSNQLNLVHTYYDEAEKIVRNLGIINVFDFPSNSDKIKNVIRECHEEYGNYTAEGDYILNNERTFVINIVDHTRLIAQLAKEDEIQRVINVSSSLFQARNKYRCTNILVSQCNKTMNDEENERYQYVPQVDDMFGSSALVNDADVVMSIATPILHRLSNFRGYDIDKMKNFFRGLVIIAARDYELGTGVAFESNFRNNIFTELPLPEEMNYSKYEKTIESIM